MLIPNYNLIRSKYPYNCQFYLVIDMKGDVKSIPISLYRELRSKLLLLK